VGVPGYQDREHDVIHALMDWVEKGVAVDNIVTTKFKNDDPSQVLCCVDRLFVLTRNRLFMMARGVLMMRPVGTLRLGANN
jgi:hypothetical protein